MSNSYKKRKPATLITGGSRGIGFALADLFARRGETLYLVARDLKQLQHSAYELKKIGSAKFSSCPLTLWSMTRPTPF